MTVIWSEMRGQKRYHLQSSWQIYLSKHLLQRCFLSYVQAGYGWHLCSSLRESVRIVIGLLGFYPIDPYPSLLLYMYCLSFIINQFLFRIFYFSTPSIKERMRRSSRSVWQGFAVSQVYTRFKEIYDRRTMSELRIFSLIIF